MGLRSLKPVTVSAGEIAEKASFVDLEDDRNPRTDRKHGCVSVNVSRVRVKVGGKPCTVCVQARPEVHVFLLDEWRDIRRNNIENRWNVFLERVFGTQARELVFRSRFLAREAPLGYDVCSMYVALCAMCNTTIIIARPCQCGSIRHVQLETSLPHRKSVVLG